MDHWLEFEHITSEVVASQFLSFTLSHVGNLDLFC
jgi:hypothetical protein